MASARPTFDVIIGGAGLAGLTAAYVLSRQRAQLSILVLEASPLRLGGRVLQAAGSGVDLGPAWVWLKDMPQMHGLVRELGLEERLVKQPGGSDGEYRLHGGLSLVVDRLRAALGERPQPVVVELDRRISQVSHGAPEDGGGLVRVTTHSADGSQQADACRQLLLALPPAKVAAEVALLGCDAFLPPPLLQRMGQQPVWMAPMGKLALYYESRFWDAERVFGGLQGARTSPEWHGAVQVYDAGQSTDGRGLYALVCFVVFGELLAQDGGDAQEHKLHVEKALVGRAIEQLAGTYRLDRAQLGAYKSVDLHCWRADANISVSGQSENFAEHPRPIPGLNAPADGRKVWFINTEASPAYTGMMEGAVASATDGARRVLELL